MTQRPNGNLTPNMHAETTNNRKVLVRKLSTNDFDNLFCYLQNLSAETKSRFGPHRFDKHSIIDFYKNPTTHIGYVADDIETGEIVAYAIIKIGYLEHDRGRLESYGLEIDDDAVCTFAPSVADIWKRCGIGFQLLKFILQDLKNAEVKTVVLWGGVQMDNENAVRFYQKNGFKTIGQFSHNGENLDMIRDISN